MAAPRRGDDGWGAYEKDPRQQATATTTTVRQVESAFATSASSSSFTPSSQWETTAGGGGPNPTASTAPSLVVSVSQLHQRRPPPKKAKHHRRRHVPVGPAGVWFQAQQQQQHLQQQGTKNTTSNNSSNTAARDNDDDEATAAAAAEEESGIEFTQGLLLSHHSSTTKVAPSGVAFYSPAWIAMQCSLQFVTPSLPAYLTESERYVACRPHVPEHFVMIPEILAGHCDWKLSSQDNSDNNNTNDNHHHHRRRRRRHHSEQQQQHQRLLVLVHAIQSLADNLWVAELTDETGAKINAWIQPRLVQQEQQRPKKKYIRPGLVWMLRKVTILLVTRSSQDSTADDDEDDGEEHGGVLSSVETNHDRMLLVGEENIAQVWMPPPQADDNTNNNNNNNNTTSSSSSGGGISDAEYIAWMERRNALTTTMMMTTTATIVDNNEDTELQEQEYDFLNGVATTTTTTDYHTGHDMDDLVTGDSHQLGQEERVLGDHDADEVTDALRGKGVDNNQGDEATTNSLLEIRPNSFRNDPPVGFGRPNNAALSPLDEATRTHTREGIMIASQGQRSSRSRSTFATPSLQASQQSRFEEFSAANNKHTTSGDQRPHSTAVGPRGGAMTSKGQDRADDETSIHSPVPPKNNSETHSAAQTSAAKRSLSQTKSFGLERFAAPQSASTSPPPLSATPKTRTMSPRGNFKAKALAAAVTTPQNDSTPIPISSQTADKNSPLSTSTVNRSDKENKKRSDSSSKKKRKAKSTSEDKSPKEKSSLWVMSGANMLDLFDEDEDESSNVTRIEPAKAFLGTTDSAIIANSQKQETSIAGENKPTSGSSTKANATKPATSLFQASAFASMEMGEFSEEEED